MLSRKQWLITTDAIKQKGMNQMSHIDNIIQHGLTDTGGKRAENSLQYEDMAIRTQVETNDQIKLELIGFLKCPPGWVGKIHTHNFWEIIFVNKHNAIIYYKEQKHLCPPGDFYLIAPGEKHQFTTHEANDTEILYVGFSFCFDPIKKVKENLSLFLENTPEKDIVLSILGDIARLLEGGGGDSINLKRYNILECIIRVVNLITVQSELPRDRKNARWLIIADKVKNILMKHINKNLTIEEIAGQLYISPHYLGDIFKQTTGMSLKQYHNYLRMEYALTLVNNNVLSISDIAERLGFENIHYFSRRFKEHYKVSPSYLRNLRKSKV